MFGERGTMQHAQRDKKVRPRVFFLFSGMPRGCYVMWLPTWFLWHILLKFWSFDKSFSGFPLKPMLFYHLPHVAITRSCPMQLHVFNYYYLLNRINHDNKYLNNSTTHYRILKAKVFHRSFISEQPSSRRQFMPCVHLRWYSSISFAWHHNEITYKSNNYINII